MNKPDQKHMTELALIRSIPDLIVGGLKRGRLKGLMTKLQKAVDVDLCKMPKPTSLDLKSIEAVLDTFGDISGWNKKGHHTGTLVCFCLSLIDRSDRKFNGRILQNLNEIADYYDRAGDLSRPSLWAGDLACKKWNALFGIVEDDGPDSADRLKTIDADLEREKALEEYRAKMYPESVKEAS